MHSFGVCAEVGNHPVEWLQVGAEGVTAPKLPGHVQIYSLRHEVTKFQRDTSIFSA
jgi:hypothetical protein